MPINPVRKIGRGLGRPANAHPLRWTSAITMSTLSATLAGLLALASGAFANEEHPMPYPETRREAIADERSGVRIPDPYRWLENDIRRDPELALWVNAQNRLSEPYFAGLPGRDIFRQRLTALYDHERLSTPEKRGSRNFFTRNTGLQAQPIFTSAREATASSTS